MYDDLVERPNNTSCSTYLVVLSGSSRSVKDIGSLVLRNDFTPLSRTQIPGESHFDIESVQTKRLLLGVLNNTMSLEDQGRLDHQGIKG